MWWQVPSTKSNKLQIRTQNQPLQKNIGGKVAYHDLPQTLQKWELCALGTTFNKNIFLKFLGKKVYYQIQVMNTC